MANIYWVGGAGTWDSTTTTNWASSSGGTGGTGTVPTAADNVFFNQAGTYQVLMYGSLSCLDLTVSAGTVTFAGDIGPPNLTISGSMTLIAGTIWSSQCSITFNATTSGKTITTNGVSIGGPITFNGSGGEWTLGSALVTTNTAITLTAGSLNSGNYNITAPNLSSSGTLTRSLTLGSSTVTLTAANPITISTTTNFTFNCGTSTITFTYVGSGGNTAYLYFGKLTYYNISITGVNTNTIQILTGLTCNNWTVSAQTSATSIGRMLLYDNITCTGTFTTTGYQGSGRFMYTGEASSLFNGYNDPVPGVARTITAAAVSLSDVDFRDITAAGAAAPFTGTRLGDGSGNSNITFSAPKTVYFVNASSGVWQSGNWSNTSGAIGGGTTSYTYYPLLHDTAVIDNNSAISGGNLFIYSSSSSNYPAIGEVTFANRNTPITVTYSGSSIAGPQLNGNITLSPSVNLSLGTLTLSGSGNRTRIFNNNGANWFTSSFDGLTVSCYGIWQLGSDLYMPLRGVALNSGNLDLNDKNCTVSNFATASSASFDRFSKTLTMGNGKIVMVGSIFMNYYTNAATLTTTFSANASIVMTSAAAKTFYGVQSGTATRWPTIVQAGAGALTIRGKNNFYNITNTVTPCTVNFGATSTANSTVFSNGFSLRGSAGSLVTVGPSAAGVNYSLDFSNLTVGTDYLNVSYCTATNGTVYVGANSTDGGNNTGLTFTAAPASISTINVSVSGGAVISGGVSFT